MALQGEVAGSAGKIFGQLNDADLKFGFVTDDAGQEVGVFLADVFPLPSLLCVQERLPSLLLPHLFRGRVQTPVGGQEHRSHGHHDISLPQGLSLRGTVHRLRGLRACLPRRDSDETVYQKTQQRRTGDLFLGSRAGSGHQAGKAT